MGGSGRELWDWGKGVERDGGGGSKEIGGRI